MTLLIWPGAALTLAGVAMLIWCMGMVYSIRKRALPEAEARAALQKAVALNLGALAVSGLGLMLVVVGVILG